MKVQSISNTNFKGGLQSPGFIKAVEKAVANSSGGKELQELFAQCQKKMSDLGIDVFVTPPTFKKVEEGAIPVWFKSIFTRISFKYDKSAPKNLQGKFADKMFRLNLSGNHISLEGGYYTDKAIPHSSEKYPDVQKVLQYIDANARYLDINKKASVYYTRTKLPLMTTYENKFHYPPEEVKKIINDKNIVAFCDSKDFVPNKIPFITGDTRLFSQSYGTEPVVLHWIDKAKDPGVRIKFAHEYNNGLYQGISYTSPETQKIYQRTQKGELIGNCEPYPNHSLIED